MTLILGKESIEMLKPVAESRPPYCVPSMSDIGKIAWNGFKAISTFSGCGGSSLGYKMAGFKVLWANEFIPAAQATYRANHPDTILDTRDIRKIRPEDILEAIKMVPGELDLFDGSPPCASFSTAGKREAGWGKVKAYSDTKQRTDDLFFEYARLVRGVKPKVFVAENVSGLVKGTAKGYFLEILKELKSCGYSVEARLLDAQWLGVPQMRQRIIFVGVRSDLACKPAFPRPLSYRYSVRDALTLSSSMVAPRDHRGGYGEELDMTDRPSPTVLSDTVGNFWIEGANGHNGHAYYPDDQPMATVQASRPVNDVNRPPDVAAIESRNGKFIPVDNVARTNRASDGARSSTTLENDTGHVKESDGSVRKFSIVELKRICAFPDDFVLTGTYAQQWERLGRAVPPVMMFHIAAAIRDQILCKLKTK